MVVKKTTGGAELEFDLVVGANTQSAVAIQDSMLGSSSEVVVGEYVIGGAIVGAYLRPWCDEVWMRGVTDTDIVVDLTHTSTTRLRTLSDMDGYTLSAFDSMQIAGVDYITI